MQRVDRRKRGVAVTSQHRTTALQIGFLFLALCAYGAVKSTNVRVTVLDSETHTVVLDNSGVPKNCDAVNFDAYCHNSKTTQVTNTLLVQEGSRTPFRISCNVDTKWSRCAALPKGQTFEAKPEKHGLVVYYADDSGKLRKQLYTLDEPMPDKNGEPAAETTATVPASQSVPPAEIRAQTPVPAVASQPGESVKCSFTSTPPGAEVTIDGRYLGSTPSMIRLSTGIHTIQVTLPGFSEWKKDLTVTAGSELTVNAILQKKE